MKKVYGRTRNFGRKVARFFLFLRGLNVLSSPQGKSVSDLSAPCSGALEAACGDCLNLLPFPSLFVAKITSFFFFPKVPRTNQTVRPIFLGCSFEISSARGLDSSALGATMFSSASNEISASSSSSEMTMFSSVSPMKNRLDLPRTM